MLSLIPFDESSTGWAEHREADFQDGCFVSEDYYMEIDGLTK